MVCRTSASASQQICSAAATSLRRAVAIALLLEQPPRELRLQRDLRQRLAQHVVQLIRDSLALGNLGEATQVHAQPDDPDLPGDRDARSRSAVCVHRMP